MIISDLNHLENVTEAPNLLGGAGDFEIDIFKDQDSDLKQIAVSDAYAKAQFGGAAAVSTVANTADVTQYIG